MAYRLVFVWLNFVNVSALFTAAAGILILNACQFPKWFCQHTENVFGKIATKLGVIKCSMALFEL